MSAGLGRFTTNWTEPPEALEFYKPSEVAALKAEVARLKALVREWLALAGDDPAEWDCQLVDWFDSDGIEQTSCRTHHPVDCPADPLMDRTRAALSEDPPA